MSSAIIIHDDFFLMSQRLPPIHLTIADPPFGGVVNEEWDNITEKEAALQYIKLMIMLADICVDGAAAYVFFGIGKPGMRPFWKALPIIEEKTPWNMSTQVTWKKRRAYGIQWGFLFVREEIAMFVKGDIRKPRVFNVPYLEEKRGYDGYNKNYPCKSEYKRRTNIWDDVTEILRGKTHPCQKPDKLYEVMISTSSNPGDTVLEVFGGSCGASKVAALMGRTGISIEKNADYITKKC